MSAKNPIPKSERRRYIRLDSVFPVQFQLSSPEGKNLLSDWLQGFTNNVGKGGICLCVNNLNPQITKLIRDKQARFSLKISIPLSGAVAKAQGSVAWMEEVDQTQGTYLIGLHYDKIDTASNNRIMRYAWVKKFFVPSVLTIIFILGIAMAISSFINIKLIKGNRVLVEQLVEILQESSVAKQKIKQINKEKEDLDLRIQALHLQIQALKEERHALSKEERLAQVDTAEKIAQLQGLIEKLTQEKTTLQEQLINLQSKENEVSEGLLRLDKKKITLEKANFDKMYQWLRIHQNPRTGLVMSFEGDSEVANWAFTYDQALLIQAYTIFGDFERARKILDFFTKKAQKSEGLFFNAYYVQDGQPAEYTLHCGPNLWLGIAALQYSKKTQDLRYLNLSERIAQAIISLQSQDKDGGIRGGPNVTWFSTEHNLDAYAFFNLLYKMTQKKPYLEAATKVLNWLLAHTYDRLDIPIKRGKGDSTIATDTYAWSIAAIGPEKLEELKMDPDRILEFAEENCSVEVEYSRPDGRTVLIKGFDFAPQRNLARGGVVSSEWTAQMVLAFKIMADFYFKKGLTAKAHAYALKADAYLSELENMIISSPSPSGQGQGCLPYATEEFVDTGHGWMTPKGKSTGSVAGTVYTLFAYYKYNPLQLSE